MLLKLPHHLCLLTPFSVPTFINFSPEDHVHGKTSAHPRCFCIPTRTHPLAVPLCSGWYMQEHTGSAVHYREEGCEKDTSRLGSGFHPYLLGIAASLVLEWLSMGSRWLCSLVPKDSSLCAVKYCQRAKERLSKHSVQKSRWGVFHLDLV